MEGHMHFRDKGFSLDMDMGSKSCQYQHCMLGLRRGRCSGFWRGVRSFYSHDVGKGKSEAWSLVGCLRGGRVQDGVPVIGGDDCYRYYSGRLDRLYCHCSRLRVLSTPLLLSAVCRFNLGQESG